jgi:hypothetical protein
MNDSSYMFIIVREIEKKLNWGKKEFWKDYEYKKLSQLIYDESTISISPQTLKRLFGKVKYKNDYHSQPATKDALAKFLKFSDWEEFIQSQAKDTTRFASFIIKIRSKWKKIALWTTLSLIFAIIIFVSITGVYNRKVSFYAENMTGITPHTVSFHYDISKLKGKEFYIEFDNNEAENKIGREILDKHRNVINHCFEAPGYYKVNILSRDIILDSVKIHVLSDGWVSYYFNDDNFIQRKFIFELDKKARDTLNDGLLYISPKELNNQGFKGNTVYYLEHMLYKDFGVDEDSCTLEVRYKNSPDMGGISCYDVEFRVIGEDGLASVMLVQKGCYRWSEIVIGEKHLNGKFNDLSFLSTDLSSWNVFRLKIESQLAQINIGNNTVFKGSYQRPLGKVKGIRLVTKGSGAFDYVRLTNYIGQVIYEDNFGE